MSEETMAVRLDRIVGELTASEAMVEKLEAELEDVGNRLQSLEEENAELRETIKDLELKIESARGSFDSIIYTCNDMMRALK